MARHLASGSLDPSFGTAGIAALGALTGYRSTVALQASGAIVVAVRPTSNVETNHFEVLRLGADGRREPTFGDAGVASTVGAGSTDLVDVRADDGVIAGGHVVVNSTTAFAITRYLPDGARDTSFGADGTTASKPNGAALLAMATATNGRTYLAGLAAIDGGAAPLIAAFLPDGKPDRSFGNVDGVVVTRIADENISSAASIAVDREGRVILGGSVGGTSARGLALCRFTMNGVLDARFGAGGCTVIDVGTNSHADGLAFDRAGRIVVAGIASGQPLLARFWP